MNSRRTEDFGCELLGDIHYNISENTDKSFIVTFLEQRKRSNLDNRYNLFLVLLLA